MNRAQAGEKKRRTWNLGDRFAKALVPDRLRRLLPGADSRPRSLGWPSSINLESGGSPWASSIEQQRVRHVPRSRTPRYTGFSPIHCARAHTP